MATKEKGQKLEDIVKNITTDFFEFCRICLTIPQRDIKSPPSDSDGLVEKPLILTTKQKQFIELLETKSIPGKVILKCRQRGYTTVSVAYTLWKTLYFKNQNILYLIDDGKKARELYQILKAQYNSIPPIFLPNGVLPYLTPPARLENPLLNSVVKFDTAKEDSARSGTYTMIVLDEIAFYDERVQDSIMSAINPACPNNKVFISTPKKENDLYHNMVLEAKVDGTLFEHTFFEDAVEWYGSLENAKVWREHLEKGMTKGKIAREFDCEFKGAVEERIYDFDTTPLVEIPTTTTMSIISLDLGWNDPTAVIWAYDFNGYLHIHDELVTDRTSIPNVINEIKARGHKIKYGICDSSGKKVDQTSGISIHSQLQNNLGMKFLTHKTEKEEMIRLVVSAALKGLIKISPKCSYLLEMLNNYEFKTTSSGGSIIPHNDYSHMADSLNYLILNWLQAGKAQGQKSGMKPRNIRQGGMRLRRL